MKKGDIIIIGIIAVAIISGFALILTFKGAGRWVIIEQNNKATHKLSLYKDEKIELSGNTVVIENGEVYINSATCDNQICVKHQKISEKGERIVCLPNRVVVEIE